MFAGRASRRAGRRRGASLTLSWRVLLASRGDIWPRGACPGRRLDCAPHQSAVATSSSSSSALSAAAGRRPVGGGGAHSSVTRKLAAHTHANDNCTQIGRCQRRSHCHCRRRRRCLMVTKETSAQTQPSFTSCPANCNNAQNLYTHTLANRLSQLVAMAHEQIHRLPPADGKWIGANGGGQEGANTCP